MHNLLDIIVITICAVTSGADTWGGIETYGRSKYEWLKGFLELSHGIPSHDTLTKRLRAGWDNDYLFKVLVA